jgi:PAS domain S-box-containing protein
VESFNSAAVKMFGYSAEEVLGKPVKLLLPPPLISADKDGISDEAEDDYLGLASQAGGRREVIGQHKSGTLFPVELAISSTVVAGTSIITAVVHDITERRKIEENLRRSNKDLEQFAYIASHDLKEPLRMISSYLQLLDRRYRETLDDNAKQYIHYAVDGALRLRTLIDDLLEFSRVGTNGGTWSIVDVAVVLKQTCETLQLVMQEAGAEISHGELPLIYADEGQCRLVMQNLIANAMKFRREVAPHVEFWCLTVEDNGIGIERQYFERVFVIFQRLHAREQYEGTGMGLAICKKIVERHGGSIWLESELGQGTRFHFTMPAVRESCEAPMTQREHET